MAFPWVLTFDESSVWDPKVVREYLDIPEDQLNILRNLPEWSSRQISTSRVENDSQPTQFISNITWDKNKVLFDESSDTRKSILEAYKLKSSVLFKSFSLFEIDKISSRFLCNHNLRESSSVPNIYLCSGNLHPKDIDSQISKIDSSSNIHLSISNKNNTALPVCKESKKAYITDQANKNTSELEEGIKTSSEKSNMEVDAQLPVTSPRAYNQVKIILRSNVEPTNHTSEPQTEFIASNDQPSLLGGPNNFPNSISGENSKGTILIAADNGDVCEKSPCKVTEEMVSKSCNSEEIETVAKLRNSEGLVKGIVKVFSCEKNKVVLNVTDETVHVNGRITDDNIRIETKINIQEITKEDETRDQCGNPNEISKELSASDASLNLSNQPEVPCDINMPKMDVENSQQTIHEDLCDDKSVFAETLSIKRKLESKNRSLKKRKKHGHHEERSMKKAGEVRYSVEHVNTMLDIINHFFKAF